MINRKGEISAVVILGTLVVMGAVALLSSTVNNQRQVTDTKAAENSCANNPVPPPDGGYTWVANCAKSCTSNTDCPQNTTDSSNVNPQTSNWCFGFLEGARCLQLQKGSVTTVPPNNNPSPNVSNNPQNTGSGIPGVSCTVATGCGGSCNSNFNQGCGFAGCRAWEDCVNNTCIDTTNLGTQAAGTNACNSLANADSPENKLLNTSQQTPTLVPQSSASTTWWDDLTPTQVPQTTKLSPPPNKLCSQGYKWCPGVNVCSLEYESCPVGTNTPIPNKSCSQGYKWCPGVNVCSLEYESCPQPTPTIARTDNGLPIPPLPTQTRKKIKVENDTIAKACTGTPSIDNGCIDVFGFYPQ